MKYKKTAMQRSNVSLFVLSVLFSTSLAWAADIQIDEIDVSGQVSDQKSDKAFTQAGGVVIRSGENKQSQSLDSVVRALPGTYTNMDPTQGTMTINIRGMAGFGRVNTTIDGVPQTFYGTSSNSSSRYHDSESNPSSQFGTMIDPNFLSEIAIHKGFTQGSDGINALAGSAMLKTIGVDDVIFKGNKVGVLSKFSYGYNDLGYSGMLALAGRTQAFTETGNIGAMFAYGEREIGSNYRRGNGTYANSGLSKFLNQKPTSWLAKVEINPSDAHHLLLSARDYQSNIGGRKLINQNYLANYRFSPDSDWVDFELTYSDTRNKQNYNADSSLWSLTDASTQNNSRYINGQNTSYFKFGGGGGQLNATLGATYLTNNYQRKAKGVNADNFEFTPFSPIGKQRIYNLYFNTKWQQSIYSIETGLRYSRTNFTGFKPACDEVVEGVLVPCFPQGAANIKREHRALEPSIMLSAEISPWFSPFISYSKTSRMPNIQEVFFSNQGGGSMNPFLKPEKADNYQIGFNTFKQGWLTEDDKLGIKLLYYRSKITNYIYSAPFYLASSGRLVQDSNNSLGWQAQISVNSLKPVKTSGVELELDYDMGIAYSRLSYSYEKTSQPINIQSALDGYGVGDIYELPKHYAVLDLGTRLFDKKLTLGSLIKYTGKVKRLSPKGVDTDTGKLESQAIPAQPIVVDFYAHYAFNKNFSLKVGVQNAFDVAYVDPLNIRNTTSDQYDVDDNDNDVYTFTNYGRGRTFVIGGEIRF